MVKFAEIMEKHGDPGRDKDYGRMHPEGSGSVGGNGGTSSKDGKVFETEDLDEAISYLARGEKVVLNSKKDANTLLQEMKDYTDNARAKGEDAGNLDLCRVSVRVLTCFVVILWVLTVLRCLSWLVTCQGSDADKMLKTKMVKLT